MDTPASQVCTVPPSVRDFDAEEFWQLSVPEPPEKLGVHAAFGLEVYSEFPYRHLRVKEGVMCENGGIERRSIEHTFRLEGDFENRMDEHRVKLFDDIGEPITRRGLAAIADLRASMVGAMDQMLMSGQRAPVVSVATTLDEVLCRLLLGVAPVFGLADPPEDDQGEYPVGDPRTFSCNATWKTDMLIERVGWRPESSIIRDHVDLGLAPLQSIRSARLGESYETFLMTAVLRGGLCTRENGEERIVNDDTWGGEELAFRSPLWRQLHGYRRFCHGV